MRALLVAFVPLLLLAQGQPPAATPAKPEVKPEAKAEAKPEAKPAAEAPPPAQEERQFSGGAEFGYRWIPAESGNSNAYRSVVNLGEGPKLFNAHFSLRPLKSKLFDEAAFAMRSWGGEPYNSASLDIRKTNIYNFRYDYRDIDYFNMLPSFANPLISSGSLLNQNSFDTRIRSSDLRLDLFPSRRIAPYFAYGRVAESGAGVWDFTRQGNEYPVSTQVSNHTDHYRGGVQFSASQFHLTLEQGATMFRDDQGASENIANPGNRRQPFLGVSLGLTGLTEWYRVRGESHYTRAQAAWQPAAWGSFTGAFLYANPTLDVQYSQNSTGVFVIPRTLAAASRGQDLFTGTAQMPQPSGSARGEIRPHRRIRIIEFWTTDRLHNDASGLLAEQYLAGGSVQALTRLASDRLILNQSQLQSDVFFDVTSKLTARGGYRYTWGDAVIRGASYAPVALFPGGSLERHTGLAGLAYRVGSRVRLNSDFEAASTTQAFFRTSLRDYKKLKTRGTYTPRADGLWRISADYTWLNNENPDPSVNWDFGMQSSSAVLEFLPGSGKRYSVLAEYTRLDSHSRINYVLPETFTPARSIYVENANAGTFLIRLTPGGWHPRQPGLTMGSSLYASTGSRPTRFYRPLARLSVPIRKSLAWNAEWRWYSMTQRIYSMENFGSHQFVMSLSVGPQ